MPRRSILAGFGFALLIGGTAAPAQQPHEAADRIFAHRRIVIDADIPGGYQVEVADVNGDGRPDVVGLGGGTCVWYENPSWTRRVISNAGQTPGIISSATADLDGDGRAEVAVAYEFAMNEPAKGKLALAVQGPDPDAPWKVEPVADVGSIHRLRWGDVDGDGRPDLVVAPIFGPGAGPPSYNQAPARIAVFRGVDARPPRPWRGETVGDRPVLHAIRVVDFDGDGRDEVLSADNLGVGLFDRSADGGRWSERRLTAGASGPAPQRGSSEIHPGRFADGRRFLATIDPWHGEQVVVTPERVDGSFGPPQVLDSSLKAGHALWVADVDGDGGDEIFAGFRGPGASVLAYRRDAATENWARTVLDPAVAAQDLRGGDLDGDGTPDVVAVGGSTHNLVWYRFGRQ